MQSWSPSSPARRSRKRGLRIFLGTAALLAVACDDIHVEYPRSIHDHWWDGFDALGMQHHVFALAEHDGDFVAGGLFLRAGEVDANCVARWTGSEWRAMGRGMRRRDCATSYCPASVAAFTTWNGRLVAGGRFTVAGGEAAQSIAMWDGTQWWPIGDGFDGDVVALAVYRGELVAGGEFTVSGSTRLRHVARWNGTAWVPLGNGTTGPVRVLYPFGDALVAAGDFVGAGDQLSGPVARWNGSAWAPMGCMLESEFKAFTTYRGELLGAGWVVVDRGDGQLFRTGVVRWAGECWVPFGPDLFQLRSASAFCEFEGQLVAAANLGGDGGDSLVRWDGTRWEPISSPVFGTMLALQVHRGAIVAGGTFDRAGDRASHFIGRWTR